jgi:hypothetical protein
MGGLLWVDSAYAPWSFLLVVVALGGAAAFAAGRALAQTWRPVWQAFAYAAALAAAAGFLQYVLFADPAIPGARIVAALAAFPGDPGASIAELGRALRHFGVIFITLSLIAAFGYRLTRARAMASQYGFEMERAGLLSWREKR